MNLFLDNTFAPGLSRAAALIAGPDGHVFLHMLDLFREDPGDDTVWIPRVAGLPGEWVVLSGDRKLLKSPQNRAALLASTIPVFVMPSGFPDHHRWLQASKFFKYLPGIAKVATKIRRGDFFDVQENGSVKRRA